MLDQITGPHQGQAIARAGKPLAEARAVLILMHGRGATAVSILDLATYLPHPDMAYLAPQAANNSWYPFSFLAPLTQNEPGRSSGLQAIRDCMTQAEQGGIPTERIILGCFSQGACLAAEFVAHEKRPFGGLFIFSGGLMGPQGSSYKLSFDLQGMSIFIGCSDIDFHIPLSRVEETATAFKQANANVTKRIYPNMGHTINQDEIDQAQQLVANGVK